MDGNGSWHFVWNSVPLDVGVDPRDGYHVHERVDRQCLPVAHKIKHLIGTRVVTSSKRDGEITEAQQVRALEAVV